MHPIDNLLTLCDAALMVEKRDAAMSRNQKNNLKIRCKQSREPEETFDNKLLFSTQTVKRCKGKLPSKIESIFYENTSDELNKKFSYRCTYSPTECSVVVKSYGSETKALSLIQNHIIEHIKNEPDAGFRRILNPPPPMWPLTFLETALLRGSNSGQLTSQEPAEKDESKVDILQFEHDYAKRGDEPPVRNSEDEWKRKKRVKVNAAHDKSNLQFLDRCLRGQSYIMPSCVPTGPFPFVHHPDSLEPAAVVEFYSSGEPVDMIEPAYIPSCELTRIVFKKKLQSLANKRKPKVFQAVEEVRSVLECVENRVACKPTALCAEQKDALVPHKGIENSENMEAVAKRNILMLTQQRKKRRCRDKPSVYICEICNKHFTANTSLTYHYMGHLKIKPFSCKICFRTFTRRHSLKYHMMIHNGKNRFECSVCEKQFRHPSHYKEHLRKHTGEEPYSCKFCSNNFKTRNSFKRHLRMQHQKLLTSNGIIPICEDN